MGLSWVEPWDIWQRNVQPRVGKFGCIWLEWFARGQGTWLQIFEKCQIPTQCPASPSPSPPPALHWYVHKNYGACENLAICRSQKGLMERRTFTFEQQRAQLDFIVQGNEFLIQYNTIIIIKVDQKLSSLFQGTHSQTFNKVKKSLWPSPLLKLKACFSRQVDVVPPQPVAAKVTVLYVAVHLNLFKKSVLCHDHATHRKKHFSRGFKYK